MKLARNFTLLALTACSGATVAKTQDPPPAIVVASPSASASVGQAPAKGDARIAKALARMAKVRELSANKEVPGVVLTRDAMLAKVRAHVDTEIPKEVIVREGRDLILADLIPEKTDYLATTFALLEEELAGFYAPEDGTMYVADDLKGELAAATLNHEIVHALQDQHFGLKDRMKFKEGTSDRAEATSSLAEGDATSAMFDAMFAAKDLRATDIPDEQTISLMSSSMASGKAEIPPLLRVGLVAPYLHGLLFVNGLRRSGGWAAVDAAWANPPTTTEQILHVDKFLAHEAAIVVNPPTFATLGPTAKQVSSDQIGELGLGLLAQGWLGAASPDAPLDDSSRAQARQLFVGWGGGQSAYIELTKGSIRPSASEGGGRAGGTTDVAIATAYKVVFDGNRPTGARDAFAALAPALLRRGATPKIAAKGDAAAEKKGTIGFRCVERPSKGALAIGYARGEFFLLAGPTIPGAKSSDPWKSASDCALVKTWFEELTGPAKGSPLSKPVLR